MNNQECEEFVKNFFEKYYEKLNSKDDGIELELPGVDS